MKAVLLCPGPSLSHLESLPECTVAVGVNRAAVKFPCHVWACSDYPLIRDWRDKVQGKPRLFTKRQTWEDIKHRGWFDAAMIAEEFRFPVPGWQDKTATAALAMLYKFGAKVIEVYGADWTPEPDWDGGIKGEDRTPERWRKEMRVWGAMTEFLFTRGVEVYRYGLG